MNYLKYTIDNRQLDSCKQNPYSESLPGGKTTTNKGGFWKPNSQYWDSKKGKNTQTAASVISTVGSNALELLNKGAHNEVGDALNAAGDVAMAAPPPYGFIAAGVLKTAGFITNGFTNTVNEEYRQKKLNEINDYGSQLSNATSYESLAADQNEMSSQNVELGDLDQWGDAGWFSSGSKRRRAREEAARGLASAQQTRINNLGNTANNINITNTENQLANLTAEGGQLDIETPVFMKPKVPSLLSSKISWKDDYKQKSTNNKGSIRTTRRQVQETDVNQQQLDNILANGGMVEILDDDRLKENDTFEFNTQEELDAFLLKHNLTDKDYIIE